MSTAPAGSVETVGKLLLPHSGKYCICFYDASIVAVERFDMVWDRRNMDPVVTLEPLG